MGFHSSLSEKPGSTQTMVLFYRFMPESAKEKRELTEKQKMANPLLRQRGRHLPHGLRQRQRPAA